MSLSLLSWNVNGLRSLEKSGYWDFLPRKSGDIFCLQETKASPDQLSEGMRNPKGYHSYFSSSQVKKGYSGVALYSKIKPKKVTYGMGVPQFDEEGRIIVAHYDDFVLLNVYFPNGGSGPERLQYKLDFYDTFLAYSERVRKGGAKIIFCGDVNTAHEEIDLARPKENEMNSGFLQEERAWLDEVANLGYIDTFRYFYPNKKEAYTYWDMQSHARDRNVGWRIDYFFVSANLQKRIKGAGILPNVFGSDHCPITLEI